MASAEIISIGSELLLGQIVDTNSAWIANRLTALGVDLFYKTVVGDNPGRMIEIIDRALDRSDIVITGGGLGPTQDDLTREIISEVTGRDLRLESDLLEEIEQRFRSRGFVMTANNERQAFIPDGAIPIRNPNGTAPSFIVEEPRGVIFALPGVPFELKWLFDNEVAPYLQRKFRLQEVINYRVLKVADIGESSVDDRIGHLIADSSNPTVGVLAHPGQVDVLIAAKAINIEEASRLIDPVEEEVRGLLGHHVFGSDDESMETVVGELLVDKRITVASYEDLTGGLLSERLIQASEDHFVEGVVGNSTSSICRLLEGHHIPGGGDALLNDLLGLTRELALAVRSQMHAGFGVAVHGVPDPSDSAENLAAGQTFIVVTDGVSFKTRTYNTAGRGLPDRTRIVLTSLNLLRLALDEGME